MKNQYASNFASLMSEGEPTFTNSVISPRAQVSVVSRGHGSFEGSLSETTVEKFTTSKICSKAKDIDLAALQHEAFKSIQMTRHDPDVLSPTNKKKGLQVSYFPNCQLSHEL